MLHKPKVLNNFREILISKNSIINVFHHLAILQSLMAAIFFDVASKNLQSAQFSWVSELFNF